MSSTKRFMKGEKSEMSSTKRFFCVFLALLLMFTSVPCAFGSETTAEEEPQQMQMEQPQVAVVEEVGKGSINGDELYTAYKKEAADIYEAALELEDTIEYAYARSLLNDSINQLKENICTAMEEELFTDEQEQNLIDAVSEIDAVVGSGVCAVPEADDSSIFEDTGRSDASSVAPEDALNATSGTTWRDSYYVKTFSTATVSWKNRSEDLMLFQNLPKLPSTHHWFIVCSSEKTSYTSSRVPSSSGGFQAFYSGWAIYAGEGSSDVDAYGGWLQTNGDIIWGGNQAGQWNNYIGLFVCKSQTNWDGSYYEHAICGYQWLDSPVNISVDFDDDDYWSWYLNLEYLDTYTIPVFESETITTAIPGKSYIGADFKNYVYWDNDLWDGVYGSDSGYVALPTTIAKLRTSKPTFYNNTIACGAYWASVKSLNIEVRYTLWPETFKFNINGGTGTTPSNFKTTFWGNICYDPNDYYDTDALGISKKGYSFSEWNTKADGSGAHVEDDIDWWEWAPDAVENIYPDDVIWPITSTKNATITIYAIWSPNPYTIAFNGNGNTGGEMSNLAMKYGTAKNLTANAFTRTGFSFLGWNTSASATTAKYANKASVNNLTATADATATLYALWKPNAPTLTVKQGSTVLTSDQWVGDATIYFSSDGALPTGIKNYQYSIDGGSWQTTTSGKLAFSTVGTHTVKAKATSSTGIVSNESAAVTVNIDGTPPTYTVVKTPDSWSPDKVTLKITGADDGSGYAKMQFNNGEWSTAAENEYTVTANGNYALKVQDVAGNSTTATITIDNIDKTPPTYSLSYSEKMDAYTSKDIILTVVGDDDASGYAKMQFNNGAWSTKKTNQYTVTENGTYTLTVVDAVGNSVTDTITIENIDKTPPEVPTITAKQGASRVIENDMWANGDVTFTFSGTYSNLSGVRGYVYTTDGGTTWKEVSGTTATVTIDTVGWQTIRVKAVSTSGVHSAATEPFDFGIDKTPPQIDLVGNPTQWTQKATIKANVSDAGGSGLFEVFVYDENDQPIVLQSPYTYEFTENGTYTFGVSDVAGNITTKEVQITKLDSEPPVIEAGDPRKIEFAPDRSYATIHLKVHDVGASGLKTTILPDGTTDDDMDVDYEVNDNDTFTFTAIDNAGNQTVEKITVDGIVLSDDTSISIVLYTDDAVDSCTLAVGEPYTFSVNTTGSNDSDMEITCNGVGAKIVSINSAPIGSPEHTEGFSIPAESEEKFTIVVMAADKSMDSYVVTVSSKNYTPEVVSIVNGTNIRKSWYTEGGTIFERSYETYTAGREGIQIQINALEKNKNQFVTGYVTFNGINYPIEWDAPGSGILEYQSQAKERLGFAQIPVSAFYSGADDEDIDGAYAYIHLQDSLKSGGTELSTSNGVNDNVKIRTDVNGPVVILKAASTRYAVRIGLADTSYVKSATVTLTPKNGANAGVPTTTEYTHEELEKDYIYLEDNVNYDIVVVGVDVAGHITTQTNSVSYNGGIADISGGGGGGGEEETPTPDYGVLTVDFENTEGGVYSYKSRKGNYYLIGTSGTGNTEFIKHLPNFQLLDADLN